MAGDDSHKWFSLEVTAEPEAADAIEHALNELNALGTEISYMPRKVNDAVTVIGYFNELPDDEFFRDELHHALRIYDLDERAVRSVERNEVADQDWLAEWKKHWRPTEIGGFVVAPSWEEVADTGRIVIRIEPNMAFGTGTHETTQLCIKAIEENYLTGQSFLDVGTGTGILAIAAAKVFNAESLISNSDTTAAALRFFACDTDADSIKIARENAALNGVASMIEFQTGSISDETPAFDLVCANLTVDVILPRLALLLKKTRKTLVLSGILLEQEEMIVKAIVENGLADLSIQRLGEWIAVTVKMGSGLTEN
ncbi:MAG: 50S ribosomal protein L11 methyltransferase [Candidatus Binatia bacterium]